MLQPRAVAFVAALMADRSKARRLVAAYVRIFRDVESVARREAEDFWDKDGQYDGFWRDREQPTDEEILGVCFHRETFEVRCRFLADTFGVESSAAE